MKINQNNELPNYKNWIAGVLIAVLLGFLLLTSGIIGTLVFIKVPLDSLAAFGDSFGAITSLFTALAFAFVILALLIQMREMRLTWEEIREARAAQQQMARQAFFTSIASVTETWSRLAERQQIDWDENMAVDRAVVAAKEYRYRAVVEKLLDVLTSIDPESTELPTLDFQSGRVGHAQWEARLSENLTKLSEELGMAIDDIALRRNDPPIEIFEAIADRAEITWAEFEEHSRGGHNAYHSIGSGHIEQLLSHTRKEARKLVEEIKNGEEEARHRRPGEWWNIVLELIGQHRATKKAIQKLALRIIDCYTNDTPT